jgi:phosphate:Na+ symporter
MLLVGFVGRGLIALPAALALMLGADLGTTLAVQALSFDLSLAIPVLLIAGVAVSRLAQGQRASQIGRLAIGLALILLALTMIVGASEPLRESSVTTLVLSRLERDPLLALILGALFTWLMHSSVAFVLFVISLTGAGLIGLPLALALVLGANAGAGLTPIGLALAAPLAARRVLYGNLAFRLAGALLLLPVIGMLAGPVAALANDAGRAVAHFHTLFNLGLVAVFLPLTGLAARLLERLFPEADAAGDTPAHLDHLDPALFDRPPLALNAATRATLLLADKVELMLREAIHAFDGVDPRRIREIRRLEDEVDRLQEEIKLYLAQLMQGGLSAEESAQVLELVLLTTNLEHVGDIIDKGLLRLAAKKQKQGLRFSEAGWQDIRAFHELIAEQMRQALAVFVSRDAGMARDLVAKKDRLRDEEMRATERHFARLREGLPETIETSALHLDVLRDLKRINAHLTTVAYPILEQTGELRGSRLRAVPVAEAGREGKRAKAGPRGTRSGERPA